jgi:hypothetical protein
VRRKARPPGGSDLLERRAGVPGRWQPPQPAEDVVLVDVELEARARRPERRPGELGEGHELAEDRDRCRDARR